MKKVLLIVMTMFIASLSCFAANMGVQMIGGPDIDTTPASLDNMKVGETVTIDGYARITISKAEYTDEIWSYSQNQTRMYESYGWHNRNIDSSGVEADYYRLYIDITNLSLIPVDFLKDCTVIATYNDIYKFNGWCHQINWNNTYEDGEDLNKTSYIHDSNRFEINPMYTGHYMVGVTLPNAVVEGKEPLSIQINIGGNELIYNVRK